MGFLSKVWKKLKPVRKVGGVVAEAYVQHKIEKKLGIALSEKNDPSADE